MGHPVLYKWRAHCKLKIETTVSALKAQYTLSLKNDIYVSVFFSSTRATLSKQDNFSFV